MTKEICICDRCGKEVGKTHYVLNVSNPDNDNTTRGNSYDLCPDCASRFRVLMDKFLVNGQEPKTEPEPEKTEPKNDKKPRIKYSAEIMQKVQELHTEGKNYSQIAEELDINLSTLYAWLRKEKKEPEPAKLVAPNGQAFSDVAKDILAAGA